MGKRIAVDNQQTPTMQKRRRLNVNRKKVTNRNSEISNSSSSDESTTCVTIGTSYKDDAKSNAALNNSSIVDEKSPKPEYHLTRQLVNGTILTDITQRKWRIGKPIGKGSFGEIFLASNNINAQVNENAKYVVKIEPHSNGPLFVEIHCLLNTAKNTEENPLPPGMPEFIASGSHYFRNTRYRFLILPRYDRDLHSIIKNRRVDQKSILTLAVQILDVLQHIHDKGYCHSDIKAENLMTGKCTYRKSQVEKTRNGTCIPIKSEWSSNISTQNGKESAVDNSDNDEYEVEDEDDVDYDEDEVEDSDDDNDNDSSNKAMFRTPQSKRAKYIAEYSGSNPVRSCRLPSRKNSTYEEMVSSHYLRPTKRISYSEFFEESGSNGKYKESHDCTLDEIISRNKYKGSRSSLISSSRKQSGNVAIADDLITEDRIFLIDFGLASKFVDSNGVHRPFCMDQRRAHDGTLEFTSRDAHMGAHSRRSDLECLGYNLIFWSQGYLPWKDNAAQLQHEKVHWMKEYLMADVRVMLKHIYGKTVPKYLGDFMQYVGNLAYNERPNYNKCRAIFESEFERLGYKLNTMVLNFIELAKNSSSVKEEIENNNVFEMKNIKNAMKNLGILMPFRESTTGNRVSPKNLRSKSDKKTNKKNKKFSWTEILSQDPDQIARERAEKEFERDPTTETPLIRYSGKPTYAILQIQNRLKFKDKIEMHSNVNSESEFNSDDDIHIEGYTKPMMEIIRKRQASLLAECKRTRLETISTEANRVKITQTNNLSTNNNKLCSNNKSKSKLNSPPTTAAATGISKLRTGLRTVITPTKRGLDYNKILKQQRRTRRRLIKNGSGGDFSTTDESSCSSLNSVASSNVNSRGSSKKSTTSSASTLSTKNRRAINSSNVINTRSNASSSVSDEDDNSRDVTVFSPKRTRHAVGKLKLKIIKNASSGNLETTLPEEDEDDEDDSEQMEEEIPELVAPERNVEIVGARRRKRSIPQKRNTTTTKVLRKFKVNRVPQVATDKRRGRKQLQKRGQCQNRKQHQPNNNNSRSLNIGHNIVQIQSSYNIIGSNRRKQHRNEYINANVSIICISEESSDINEFIESDTDDSDFSPEEGNADDDGNYTPRQLKKRARRG